jgi:hypothetical protein
MFSVFCSAAKYEVHILSRHQDVRKLKATERDTRFQKKKPPITVLNRRVLFCFCAAHCWL